MDTSVLQREWKERLSEVLLVTGVEWQFWSLRCVFGAESRQERSSCRGEIKCWIIYSCVQTSIKLHCEALWSYSFLQAMLLLSPLKCCEIKQLLSKTANRCRVTGYRRWLLRFSFIHYNNCFMKFERFLLHLIHHFIFSHLDRNRLIWYWMPKRIKLWLHLVRLDDFVNQMYMLPSQAVERC